ncbi:ATP/GTP-binding protein [Leptolyngbya sp. FACHB-261]|uniref:GTP-binding protein n=1 Tax=Leptolyngbya sp. FACHB-261 TaxID=2692806 RepID=UPI0016879C7C|nr:ATP/GTP-binding protein [Leptolyngbya sp. FACHB-261]MBD2103578.1 ATP/GTP-binding protein [Leptolyngbya sp. FACHB-261]
MTVLRIVVTGTVGSGKTTFIRSISEIEVVDTDRTATDVTAQLKSQTTVALDFGRMTIPPGLSLHLYGTPGQPRFDFMWDILIRKAHAYVLLVAANRPDHFRLAHQILSFMQERSKRPMLIGLTHTDCPDCWTEEDLTLALGYGEQYPPVVIVNPTQPESVHAMLLKLTELTTAQPSV